MNEVSYIPEMSYQSTLPPSPALLRGIHQFNSGAYFEQHETLEVLWRQEQGGLRELYQGILQIGLAYFQISRSNYSGAMAMFDRAKRHLERLPDICQTVDIVQLRQDADKAKAELELLGEYHIEHFSKAFFAPIKTISQES